MRLQRELLLFRQALLAFPGLLAAFVPGWLLLFKRREGCLALLVLQTTRLRLLGCNCGQAKIKLFEFTAGGI